MDKQKRPVKIPDVLCYKYPINKVKKVERMEMDANGLYFFILFKLHNAQSPVKQLRIITKENNIIPNPNSIIIPPAIFINDFFHNII